jgi:hypothetical protein
MSLLLRQIFGFMLKRMRGNERNVNKINCFKMFGVQNFHGLCNTMNVDGKVHQVKCKIYTKIEEKETLLALQLDNLWKHDGRRKNSTKMLVQFVKLVTIIRTKSMSMPRTLMLYVATRRDAIDK